MKPFKFKAQSIFLPVFVLIFGFFLVPSISHASTNITATSSWGDMLGWVNCGPTNGNVTVTDSSITGYAWSANYGWINLAPTNGGVVNDGSGNLSGKAWGQNTGWIDFTGVSINSSGVFTGRTASSSIAGVINFSCANCLVTTTWRPATHTTPPSTSNSSSGSYSSGGSIPVSYIVTTTSTTTIPKGSTAYINTEAPRPVSTSTSSYLPPRIHSPSPITSVSTSSQTHWHNIVSNVPLPVKVIAGISLILIILLIVWRLIAL
jgi:hypothetical protein